MLAILFGYRCRSSARLLSLIEILESCNLDILQYRRCPMARELPVKFDCQLVTAESN